MIYYCYVLLLPLFVGTVSAGAWDDFTNNLATDLVYLPYTPSNMARYMLTYVSDRLRSSRCSGNS